MVHGKIIFQKTTHFEELLAFHCHKQAKGRSVSFTSLSDWDSRYAHLNLFKAPFFRFKLTVSTVSWYPACYYVYYVKSYPNRIKTYTGMRIVRWWCTTRGMPGLSWSTGATKTTTDRKLQLVQIPFILDHKWMYWFFVLVVTWNWSHFKRKHKWHEHSTNWKFISILL